MRSTSAATTDRKFLAEQGFDDVYHTSSPSLFTKMKKQRSIRRNKSKRDNEKAVVVRRTQWELEREQTRKDERAHKLADVEIGSSCMSFACQCWSGSLVDELVGI